MSNITKVIGGIIVAITTLFQIPAVQTFAGAIIASHPTLSSILGGLLALLTLLHVPTTSAATPTK